MDLVEPSATNDDVLVVLQAASGEQIALPMSALPKDFVPEDSGQIFMVENALDEQQEIVVESSQTTATAESQSNSENLVTLQAVETNVRIDVKPEPIVTIAAPAVPRKKQKRKETLLTRPLNEEDMKLEFLIIEEPLPPKVEVKRKPRKEYRTKKRVRMAMEEEAKKEESKKEETKKEEMKEEEETARMEENKKEETKKEETKKEDVKKENIKKEDYSPPQIPPPPTPPVTERRTRLSNSCRVATGKSYRCTDCVFSTDRINNMILHLKESCPNRKNYQ